MNGRRKPLLLLFSFVAFVTALAATVPAEASCRGVCVRRIVEGFPFCRTCEEAGEETGVLCGQSGPCGCYYIQCWEVFNLASTSAGPVPALNPECLDQAAKAYAEALTREAPAVAASAATAG